MPNEERTGKPTETSECPKQVLENHVKLGMLRKPCSSAKFPRKRNNRARYYLITWNFQEITLSLHVLTGPKWGKTESQGYRFWKSCGLVGGASSTASDWPRTNRRFLRYGLKRNNEHAEMTWNKEESFIPLDYRSHVFCQCFSGMRQSPAARLQFCRQFRIMTTSSNYRWWWHDRDCIGRYCKRNVPHLSDLWQQTLSWGRGPS